MGVLVEFKAKLADTQKTQSFSHLYGSQRPSNLPSSIVHLPSDEAMQRRWEEEVAEISQVRASSVIALSPSPTSGQLGELNYGSSSEAPKDLDHRYRTFYFVLSSASRQEAADLATFFSNTALPVMCEKEYEKLLRQQALILKINRNLIKIYPNTLPNTRKIIAVRSTPSLGPTKKEEWLARAIEHFGFER